METERPCPKEPDATRMPGTCSCVAGCPLSREFNFLKVASSFISKNPARANAEYHTGEMCPLERKNKSSPAPFMSKGLWYCMPWKYKAVIKSAQPKEPPG